MKTLIDSLVLLVVASFSTGAAAGQPVGKAPPPKIDQTFNIATEQRRDDVITAPLPKIGQIFIIGNERTRDDVVLRQVNVFPGETLNYADLRQAQKNLERLGIFKPGSVEVTAEDEPNNPASEYKNVFVKVEETSTGSLRLMAGVSSLGDPVVSIVWEERNFDPMRYPISSDDLMTGGVFRGAVLLFRLELVQVPVLSPYAPRFLQVGGFLTPMCG